MDRLSQTVTHGAPRGFFPQEYLLSRSFSYPVAVDTDPHTMSSQKLVPLWRESNEFSREQTQRFVEQGQRLNKELKSLTNMSGGPTSGLLKVSDHDWRFVIPFMKDKKHHNTKQLRFPCFLFVVYAYEVYIRPKLRSMAGMLYQP